MAKKKVADGVENTTNLYAVNQVALAKALGASKQMVQVWAKHPDCPGMKTDKSYDIAAWRNFVTSIGSSKGEANTEKDYLGSLDKRELECQLITERIEKLRIENDVERGMLESQIDVADVLSGITRGVHDLVKSLGEKYAHEL